MFISIYYSVSIEKQFFTNFSFGLTIQWMVALDLSSEIVSGMDLDWCTEISSTTYKHQVCQV